MLVKLEEYEGDFISQSVMEILETLGLINALNIRGYHITVEPIHQVTPKGMVEDTPSNHKVIIERNKFIENMTPSKFRKANANGSYSAKVIKDQSDLDINFLEKNNATIKHEVTVDANSYVWYKHSLEIVYNRPAMENLDSYIKRIFEKTADYLIESIDCTSGKEGSN